MQHVLDVLQYNRKNLLVTALNFKISLFGCPEPSLPSDTNNLDSMDIFIDDCNVNYDQHGH